MRKVCAGLVLGFSMFACGGGDEVTPPPQTPAPPPVASNPPPADTTAATPPAPPKPTMAEMQMTAMKTIVDAMNTHDSAKFASAWTDDATVMVPGGPEQHGRADVQKDVDHLFTGFKDLKFWVNRVWMKNDMVAVEWGWNGTHTGEFMPGMKPTEKQAGTMGLSIDWFTPDGQIKKEDRYWDMATMLSQLGMSKAKARPVPTPATSVESHTAKGTADEDKNIDAVKSMDGAFETKKEADFLANVTDDTVWDDMTMADSMKGKDNAKKFFGMFTKAFPDAKFTPTVTMGVEDFVIVESTMTGTQKGALGPIAATKKPVTVHGVDIVQMKDGKFVHGWSYMNNAEMLTQLGVMKPMGAPAATGGAAAKPAGGAAKAAGTGTTPAAPAGTTKATGTAPAAPAAPKK